VPISSHILLNVINNFYRETCSFETWATFNTFKQKCPKFTIIQMAKIRPIWGRSYDHNFLRFLPILRKKLAFFSNSQCDDDIFTNIDVVLTKTPIF
jgi:hypothetical protein